MSIIGAFVRDVMKFNWEERNSRVFGPDETASSRLTHLFDVTDRVATTKIGY
jgi:xylulose-5-phosphate/fructose-6-phosphate phosphoketolase